MQAPILGADIGDDAVRGGREDARSRTVLTRASMLLMTAQAVDPVGDGDEWRTCPVQCEGRCLEPDRAKVVIRTLAKTAPAMSTWGYRCWGWC